MVLWRGLGNYGVGYGEFLGLLFVPAIVGLGCLSLCRSLIWESRYFVSLFSFLHSVWTWNFFILMSSSFIDSTGSHVSLALQASDRG